MKSPTEAGLVLTVFDLEETQGTGGVTHQQIFGILVVRQHHFVGLPADT
jgi:hypothetical protein